MSLSSHDRNQEDGWPGFDHLKPEHVYVTRAPRSSSATSGTYPELPANAPVDRYVAAVRALFSQLQLDRGHFNQPTWNPLNDLIGSGRRVLIKPNWVRHFNGSEHGLECLITQTELISALLHYVVKTGPSSLVVADAPVQGCDFEKLRQEMHLDELVQTFSGSSDLEICDLRRTILPDNLAWKTKAEGVRDAADYVIFDLGAESLLEPVTHDRTKFRVTMYDPRALARTHRPGRHQYLIARAVLEADLVINMPKLKTHMKAGVTGALKNLVGINGNKEFLPHHRQGSPAQGGDCYANSTIFKRFAESCHDRMNMTASPLWRRMWMHGAGLATRCDRWFGGIGDIDGSWSGNDTVWRMCLDLQRILRYGKTDGTLASVPQRQILHLTDAVIAGEGQGPLSPEPVDLGLVTLGSSPAALEWVHAWLMGFDPGSIPIIREAFRALPEGLATFTPQEIQVFLDGAPIEFQELWSACGRSFRPPVGWVGTCERSDVKQCAQPSLPVN